MKQKQVLSILLITIFFILTASPVLYANDDQNIGYVASGFFRILTAAFQLPKYLVYKTFNGPPVVGTIDGALTGAFYTVASLFQGVFEIVRGVVPYGKYAVPFFLV